MVKKLLFSAAVMASVPAFLMADAISPASVNGTVDVGGTYTIHKTVTVNAGTPTTSKVDVLFLADVTGSMTGSITNVQASANSILSNISTLGDVQYGVASYRDFGWDDEYGDSPDGFSMQQTITSSTTAAQTAINNWNANYGADYPEAQLYALEHVATDAGWRDGSSRIVVWFGDAPGHDPTGPDASTAVTESQAISALNAKNIKVEALNVGNLDGYGQATRITDATGGTLYNGIDNSSIVSAIQDAIKTSFSTYNTVSLSVEGADNVTVTSSDPITGSFDRSTDRTFNFDVTVSGVSAGIDDFLVNALVDGGTVATEKDHFTVNGSPVPEPGLLSMLFAGLFAVAGFGIRRKY